MLITPEYQQLQTQFHEDRPDYGVSGSRHCDFIMQIAKQMNTRDILDYGCGKATLQKGIPFPIQNYDPCMPEYSAPPVPAQIVVCTDVLEHIEPECLSAVLAHLQSLTRQCLFVHVACRPAAKILPDGRNAHIIQRPPHWWLQAFFNTGLELTSFQVGKGDFTAIFIPPQQEPT